MKINWIVTIFTYITTLISILALLHLGFMWIYEGYGLNPHIAFPLAAVITVSGLYLLINTFFYEYIEDCEPPEQLPDQVLCNGPDYYVAPKECKKMNPYDFLSLPTPSNKL